MSEFNTWLTNTLTHYNVEQEWHEEYSKQHKLKCNILDCNPKDLTQVHHDWFDSDTGLIDENQKLAMEILFKISSK